MAIKTVIQAIFHVHASHPMKVAFVLCEQLLATSITLPNEMLRAAVDMSRSRRKFMPFTLNFVGLKTQVTSRCGLPIQAHHTLDDTIYDLIYLPALWRDPQPTVRENAALLPWLRRQHQSGALIGAVGTGVCLLAASGLLNARPATTHWFYLDAFAKIYPLVDVKRQHFITHAGHLYCAASINALADLTIHFIRHFFGGAIAAHVERHFSYEARKAYNDISYREDNNTRHADETILHIQLWLHQHHAEPLQLAQVAQNFGMSLRHFNRRFKNASGKSPLQYLQALRIEQARDLLKNSNLSISEVTYRVGYQDSHHFSTLFKKFCNLTPQEFRKSMRSKLFSLDLNASRAKQGT